MSEREELEAGILEQIDSGRRVCVEDWEGWRRDAMPSLARVIEGRWRATDISSAPARTYVDVSGWPYVGRDLLRPYLRRRLADAGRSRAIHTWGERRLLDWPAPNYYAGGEHRGDLAYVDIRGAHYSIYSWLGTYDPVPVVTSDTVRIGRGWIDLTGIDMFEADKLARNSLVGLARTRRWQEWRTGERHQVDGMTRVTSPGLWGCIALILSAVAQEVVESMGAVYVATDGYIVPAHRREDVLGYLRSWGCLRGRTVAHGEGQVTGHGSYAIGERATRRVVSAGTPLTTWVPLTRPQRESLRSCVASWVR